MPLTLNNATEVFEHQDKPSPARGYTCTRHYACQLTPGDLWLPDGDQGGQHRPHTVMDVRQHDGRVELVDQFGVKYSYAANAVLPTAVLDPWPLSRPRAQAHHTA